jgi:hypothetical protein
MKTWPIWNKGVCMQIRGKFENVCSTFRGAILTRSLAKNVLKLASERRFYDTFSK